ncbi:MAG: hypothetical protein QM539_10690, partial [Alphaproteobacteria bacterium]|nr:hypothetical protein [Alphaproteobacteria bacterium]
MLISNYVYFNMSLSRAYQYFFNDEIFNDFIIEKYSLEKLELIFELVCSHIPLKTKIELTKQFWWDGHTIFNHERRILMDKIGILFQSLLVDLDKVWIFGSSVFWVLAGAPQYPKSLLPNNIDVYIQSEYSLKEILRRAV